jgi:hypothetical protein
MRILGLVSGAEISNMKYESRVYESRAAPDARAGDDPCVLVEPVLAGLNAAVTPVGSPLAVRVAVPEKPFWGVTVIALVADAPCVTLRAAGAAPNAKRGAPCTVRLSVTEEDDVPAVPVTVTVDAAVAAVDVALNVSVLVVAVVAGLNEAVTPVGRPDMVRATLPVKPFLGVTVIVLVAPAPCTTLSAGVEGVNEKLAGGTTVKTIVTVALKLPDLPVTVTVLLPAAALALVTKLNVLAVAVLTGLNDAVTPLGRPAIVRLTAPLNPFVEAIVIDALPVPP